MQLKKQNSLQVNANQTREILQYELAKKNDENNKLIKKVQQQCAQYATLQEENVKLNDKIISGNDDGATRENENQQLKEKVRVLKRQVKKLTNDQDKALETIAAAKEYLNQRISIMDKSKETIKKLNKEIDNLQYQNHCIEDELQEQQTKNVRLSKEIEQMQYLMNGKNDEKEQGKYSIIKTLAELSALKSEYFSLSREHTFLEDKYDALKEEYKNRHMCAKMANTMKDEVNDTKKKSMVKQV